MPIKLSICMPTFNFAKFIGETLVSIIPQLNDQTELVILDGGSTDNTEEVIQQYQSACPHIRYFREPQRGGIDKDMHLSVEKAQGEYCWLFSSDDVMQKGAIDTILSEIQHQHDVYLCNFTICGFDTSITMEEHFILKDKKPLTFDLSNASIREKYFTSATATPAFFSFMGSLVVKRSRWLETSGHQPDFFGSCWAHAARIFRMIPSGLTVKYLPSSFLRKRSFNDSFMDKGFIHRISIAIDGYQEIANAIFGKTSLEAYHIRRTLRHEFPIGTFLSAKQHIKTYQDRKELWRLYNKTFSDAPYRRWSYGVFLFFTPDLVIRILRFLYRRQKRTLSYIRSKISERVLSN
jgi:abequosyltransferase